MWVRAAIGGVTSSWVNLSLVGSLSVVQNGTDWEVHAGSGSGAPLVRTLSSQNAAEEFVLGVLSEAGVSPL